MKKILIILTISFFSMQFSFASDLSGNIQGSLTQAESPYFVQGDLLIAVGDTVWIEPGVEIYFKGFFTLKVNGSLLAVGTESDSIYFCSGKTVQNQGDWFGIFLENDGNSSTIAFAEIQHSAHGVSFNRSNGTLRNSRLSSNTNAIECADSSFAKIHDNIIEKNFNSGLRITTSFPTVIQNEFYHNSEDGFEPAVLFTENSGGTFLQNILAFNGSSAVDCIDGSNTNIINNTIVDNATGIFIEDAEALIYNNSIVNNSVGVSLSSGSIDIRYNDVWGNNDGNYFGTAVEVGQIIGTNSYGDGVDQFDNVSVDPNFTNIAGKDFTPRSNSHIIDAGDPNNPGNISYFGLAPDIGAIEFDITTVDEEGIIAASTVPEDFAILFQNYPNPFKNQTTFTIRLIDGGFIAGSIYNMLGQKVANIVQRSWHEKGIHRWQWNARDDFGEYLSNGIYFAQFTVGNQTLLKRIMLLR